MSKCLTSERRLLLSQVPTLLIEPAGGAAQAPTVLLYHGWHSRKEDHRFLASLLAQRGYRVVMPDLAGHGERGPLEYDAPGVLQAHFWPIVIRSADEAGELLTDLQRDVGIAPQRTAVAGISMGGFIASAVLAEHPALAGLININGALAWAYAEQVFRGEDGAGLATDAMLQVLAERDPLRRSAAFFPRPVLMLHGTADRTIDVAIERYARDRLAPVYAAEPDRLELFEDPRSDHSVTLKMVERAFAWLGEYLPVE
ncbi:MAG: alpha/beta fold hydrolase [Chloroflexota bacterium]